MVYDAIVIGAGGVGSAALLHLALRGAKAIALDRFSPPHDRGSSHGRTRIIRQAYFEHPDYVPLLLRAYRLWEQLSERCGVKLLCRTGLLQIGPADGVVVSGVKESARRHGLALEELTAADIEARFPGFGVPEGNVGVLEPAAGYLRVEACVRSHLEQAIQLGGQLETQIDVKSWRAAPDHVTVETGRGRFEARRLVVTAGSWAGQLLAALGLPLEVRRKSQFWYECDPRYQAEQGCPAFLYELPEGIFYGVPAIDEHGIKIAEHTGGQIVDDPLHVNRELDPADRQRVEMFAQKCLPGVSRRLLAHSVCMYTMSPDEHFIVDRHPEHPEVAFAAGLSGHGFKFTCGLGEILADLALEGRTTLPIEFLSCRRPALRR